MKLLKSLPARELRDVIYGHLLGDKIASEDIIIEDHIYPYYGPGQNRLVNGPYCINFPTKNLVPHFYKDSFMGSQFAKEFIQALHEKGCTNMKRCKDFDKVWKSAHLCATLSTSHMNSYFD